MFASLKELACLLTLLAGLAACSGSNGRAQNSPPPTPRLPVVTGSYPVYGHAADYSWLAGRIERSLRGGLCTYVSFSRRPAPSLAGRFALVGAADLVAYPDGDMVVVFGDIDRLPDGNCGSAAYRVARIQEH